MTLTDVAPDVLHRLHLHKPRSMTGTPIAVTAAAPHSRSVAAFGRADERATFRDKATGPANAIFVSGQVLVYLVAAAAVARRRPRLLGVCAYLGLGVLAIPPLGFLAGAFRVDRIGVGPFVAALLAVGLAVGATVGWVLRRRPPLLAPVSLAFASLLVQLVDIATGGHLQIDTVFGYSPVVAGRFAGFGNVSFALVASTAIVVAAGLVGLSALRYGAARLVAWIAALSVLAVAVVADGYPALGSDVGGVLAAVPAFAVLCVLLNGGRVRLRWVAVVGGATVALVGAFAALDLARPAAAQTHLGRFVSSVRDHPAVLQEVLVRKLGANLGILTSSVWTLLVPVALAVVAVVVWRTPPALAAVQGRVVGLRATLLAGLVACVLGFAFNDSGVAVPAMMLAVLLPHVTWLAARTGTAERVDP